MKKKATKSSRLKNAVVKKKNGLKKTLKKKVLAVKKLIVVPKASKAKKSSGEKSIFDFQQMKAEQSKYYTGATLPFAQQAVEARSSVQDEPGELPLRYDEDVVVLQVRDPWWAHVYWDVRTATINKLKAEYKQDFERGRWVLRAYDVSYINFDGSNANHFFDTGIDPDARNWYLNFGAPGTSWCIDLGVVLPDGRFIMIARSNVISLPLDGPSWITDEEWMIPDDEFRRLYGMSIGLGPNVSGSVGKLWQERLKKDVTSRGIASMGVSSPVKQPKEKGSFWLVVDTELVVYGATEPDAKVTVQGKPITLREDGTFTLRYALPDGKQEISVVARSAKINEKRTITPIVTRRTTRNP